MPSDCFLIAVYYILAPHSAGGQPRWSTNVSLKIASKFRLNLAIPSNWYKAPVCFYVIQQINSTCFWLRSTHVDKFAECLDLNLTRI